MEPRAKAIPVELVIQGIPVALGLHSGKITLAAEACGRFRMICLNSPALIGPARLFLAA
jgi:hypothetical protein